MLCLPLICTIEPHQLLIFGPIQLAYGLLLRRPRWVDPWDAEAEKRWAQWGMP